MSLLLLFTSAGLANTYSESVSAAIAATASLTDQQFMIETVSALVTAGMSVVDAQAVAEAVNTTATASFSLADQQFMIETVTDLVTSGCSLQDIISYLEQLSATSTAEATVLDVFSGNIGTQRLYVSISHGSAAIAMHALSPDVAMTGVFPRGTISGSAASAAMHAAAAAMRITAHA